MTFTFLPLATKHFPLMLKWLKTPHVKKWWDQDINWTMDLIRKKYSSYAKGFKLVKEAKKPIKAFIICLDQEPIGYIQIYNAHDFPRSSTLKDLPEELGAFDVFIGEEKYLGQGLGTKAISKFLEIYSKEYSYIFADPEIDNQAAIKAYEKAGFKKLAEQKSSHELWMIYEN